MFDWESIGFISVIYLLSGIIALFFMMANKFVIVPKTSRRKFINSFVLLVEFSVIGITCKIFKFVEPSFLSWAGAILGHMYQAVFFVWYLIIGIFISKFIHFFFWEGIFLGKNNVPMPKVLQGFVDFLIFFILVSMVLYFVYDQSIIEILAVGGGLTLVMGLAFEPILGNIISGVIVSLAGNIKKENFIEVSGQWGVVRVINWNSFKLFHPPSSTDLYVPNKVMASSKVIDFGGLYPELLMKIPVKFRNNCSIEELKKFLLKVADDVPTSVNRPSLCAVEEVTKNYISFQVCLYMMDSFGAIGDLFFQSLYYQIRSTPFQFSSDIFIERAEHHATDLADDPRLHQQIIAKTLRKLPLFNKLREEDFQLMEEFADCKTVYCPMRVIIEEDEGDSFFIVHEGQLQSFERQSDGTEKAMRTFDAEDIFGLKVVLTNDKRRITVRPVSKAILIEVKREAIKKIFSQNPSVMNVFAEILAERELDNLKQQKDFDASLAEKASLSSMKARLMGQMKLLFKGDANA
jgi:small-conductance mechanosensitive channel/CRP-like cAMP-binding protein